MSAPRKISEDLLNLKSLENPEACPGCGCLPGDGITDDCDDENGCEYFRDAERGDDPIEFTETSRGYQTRDEWARGYDDLNGAPEGDWDR